MGAKVQWNQLLREKKELDKIHDHASFARHFGFRVSTWKEVVAFVREAVVRELLAHLYLDYAGPRDETLEEFIDRRMGRSRSATGTDLGRGNGIPLESINRAVDG
jgi:hypothetical protein